VRRARELLITPIVVSVNFDCGGGGGGPINADRRAEGGIVRGGSAPCALDIAGSKIDCDKWMDLQRVINPTANIQQGTCFTSLGNTRSSSLFFEAQPGDYLVTMSFGGKTYKQVLRVDRAAAGEVKP
jgi:hypothetical protein